MERYGFVHLVRGCGAQLLRESRTIDLADTAVVHAEAGWFQSCMISLQLHRTGDSTL